MLVTCGTKHLKWSFLSCYFEENNFSSMSFAFIPLTELKNIKLH